MPQVFIMKDDWLLVSLFFFLVKSIGIGWTSDSIVGFHTRCVEYQEHGKSFDKVGMFLKNSSTNKA